MSASARLESAADSGMTLGELWSFIQAAEDVGIDPRETVKVRIGWRSNLLVIEATDTTTKDKNHE